MKSIERLPYCVGLTGGIGSGKTTAANLFRHLGVPVYIADDEAKKLIDTDPNIRENILLHFGSESYTSQGLNRPFMAREVFSNPEKLKVLNSLTHPAVKEHFKNWITAQKALFVIKEAAILFEAGTYNDCDFVISIVAPENIRIERVQKRSDLSVEEIKSRIARQWADKQRIQLSDYVVLNDGKHSLIKQILHIYEDIIRRTNPGSRPIYH
ncbi:dephospho-CoA kinase [Thermaurantimonas aggregans]|uniref:Dephospho-CoA kinase n=1 Tax=Thermaurantimonas aggregans TaxID=2173829 RepID=A0A401XMZ4_9FLAO|nr:dephospho-CoA kinase [Thermaurantimonas aggregans]GCD78387.1 dephospho-CoA kinase [Thermaurantimonas aggregans]